MERRQHQRVHVPRVEAADLAEREQGGFGDRRVRVAGQGRDDRHGAAISSRTDGLQHACLKFSGDLAQRLARTRITVKKSEKNTAKPTSLTFARAFPL